MMTHEFYVAERDRLIAEISRLNVELSAHKCAWLKECPFNVGDKVRLDRSSLDRDKVLVENFETVYIKAIYAPLRSDDLFSYRFYKTKKDGTKSLQEAHFTFWRSIELIEAAKPKQETDES